MKKNTYTNLWRVSLQVVLVVSLFLPRLGQATTAYARATTDAQTCTQLLADAEARFLSTLASDGSVQVNPEAKAAATEYIRVSKLCYEQLEAQNATDAELGGSSIDEGGVFLDKSSSEQFALTGTKWGPSGPGTSGGTVTYSFMGNGISLAAEGAGANVAVTSLPGFKPCFITKIQNAFAAWQVVSNINFVQVDDNGTAFDAPGAGGDIRIGAHRFDGPSGTLAHAYFPPPNGNSAAGDLHFDMAENWSCDSSGINIGIVAMHEIGHSLGLNHEKTDAVALMDPYYNASVTSLQPDDISGAKAIYGPADVSAPPTNDDFANAKTIASTPYMDTLDTTGANNPADGPQVPAGACDGKNLKPGLKDVWYKYIPSQTKLLYLDTFGSTPPAGVEDYDTYIAVWTGSALDNLTLVGCDDDTTAGLQSQLRLSAQAGITYYIEIAQHGGDAGSGTPTPTGGNLVFHITSFLDVPGTFWAWRYVEGLYKVGVTSGCAALPNRQYCPATIVSRDQMAVFLLKAKHGASYSPPAPTGVFSDVPTNYWAAAWIERLAAEGITGGCGGGKYCPTYPVTRDQMAVFLLRAKHGSSYSPPAANGDFQDVPPAYWAAAWIEQLAAEGITTGCSVTPKNFCPTTAVSRDQMAVFLDRTFNIAPVP